MEQAHASGPVDASGPVMETLRDADQEGAVLVEGFD
jgi:hypothetical protein